MTRVLRPGNLSSVNGFVCCCFLLGARELPPPPHHSWSSRKTHNSVPRTSCSQTLNPAFTLLPDMLSRLSFCCYEMFAFTCCTALRTILVIGVHRGMLCSQLKHRALMDGVLHGSLSVLGQTEDKVCVRRLSTKSCLV